VSSSSTRSTATYAASSGSSTPASTTTRKRGQQRHHGRLADQGRVVAGDLDRHPGGASDRRSAGSVDAPGAHQHGHLGPGHAVLEVGAAQQVGEVLGLGAGGVERRARRPARGRARSAALGRGTLPVGAGDVAAERDARRPRLRGRQQPGAEPAGGAQRDHGPAAPSRVGTRREARMPLHVGARGSRRSTGRGRRPRQVAAVAGQAPEQRDLAGVGVLVLVDEHVAEAGAQLVAVLLGDADRARIRSA
jgi:hypothetical protein